MLQEFSCCCCCCYCCCCCFCCFCCFCCCFTRLSLRLHLASKQLHCVECTWPDYCISLMYLYCMFAYSSQMMRNGDDGFVSNEFILSFPHSTCNAGELWLRCTASINRHRKGKDYVFPPMSKEIRALLLILLLTTHICQVHQCLRNLLTIYKGRALNNVYLSLMSNTHILIWH